MPITIIHISPLRETHTLVWIFDQSSGHNRFADNALVASRMNVYPGGQQPIMRDGLKPNGRPQKMVNRYGEPKGLKQVLEERGVDTRDMKKEELIAKLETFDDFKYELSAVATYLIRERKYHCINLPKVRKFSTW